VLARVARRRFAADDAPCSAFFALFAFALYGRV